MALHSLRRAAATTSWVRCRALKIFGQNDVSRAARPQRVSNFIARAGIAEPDQIRFSAVSSTELEEMEPLIGHKIRVSNPPRAVQPCASVGHFRHSLKFLRFSTLTIRGNARTSTPLAERSTSVQKSCRSFEEGTGNLEGVARNVRGATSGYVDRWPLAKLSRLVQVSG
jgi:hypothetical protein